MASADIARRLSFGASKVGFDMEKHISNVESLDKIEDPKETPFHLVKFIVNWKEDDYRDVSRELKELKQYMNKVKLNYNELFAKLYFIDQLKSNSDPSAWDLEITGGEKKKEYKEHKDNNDKLIAEIKSTLTQLCRGYMQYKMQKREYEEELESIRQMIIEDENTDTINLVKKPKQEEPLLPQKPASNNPEIEEILQDNQWITGLIQTISSLSGQSNITFGKDSMQIRVNNSHELKIFFKPDTSAVQSVELSPHDIPISDIVEYTKETHDLKFLVREIQGRLKNFANRHPELETLRKSFVIHYEPRTSQVTATLPNGLIVEFILEYDYPQPYSRVLIVKIDNSVQIPDFQVEDIMSQFNKESSATLTELLIKIQELTSGLASDSQTNIFAQL